MAPQEPEWLLWAKRLQDEHKGLLHRIEELSGATAHIEPLMERTKDLVTNTQHLQQESNLLIKKISASERDALKREDAFDTELKRLRGVIGDLRQELGCSVRSLEGRIENQISREGKDYGTTTLRQPIGYLRNAAGKVIIFMINLIRLTAILAVPKTFSQATTTDESTPVSEEADGRSRYASREVLSIDPQGKMTLEAYFKYGEASVTKAVRLYEKRAVKAFVTGIAAKSLRLSLWERLDEVGWTWQSAREEIHKNSKIAMRRSKRRLGPPS